MNDPLISALLVWVLLVASFIWATGSIFILWCLAGAGMYRRELWFWTLIAIGWPICLIAIGVWESLWCSRR